MVKHLTTIPTPLQQDPNVNRRNYIKNYYIALLTHKGKPKIFKVISKRKKIAKS